MKSKNCKESNREIILNRKLIKKLNNDKKDNESTIKDLEKTKSADAVRIDYLSQTIKDNKETIAELQSKKETYERNIKELEKTQSADAVIIANLSQTIEDNKETISSLRIWKYGGIANIIISVTILYLVWKYKKSRTVVKD